MLKSRNNFHVRARLDSHLSVGYGNRLMQKRLPTINKSVITHLKRYLTILHKTSHYNWKSNFASQKVHVFPSSQNTFLNVLGQVHLAKCVLNMCRGLAKGKGPPMLMQKEAAHLWKIDVSFVRHGLRNLLYLIMKSHWCYPVYWSTSN